MIRTCIVDLNTSQVVNVVAYEEEITGQPPGMDDNYIAVASDTAQIGWLWQNESLAAPVVAVNPSVIRTAYEAAAQSTLDSFARSWGYDTLLSASSYANSTVSKYKAEANALIAWRDQVWQAAYNIEVSVQGGAPMPATVEDFLAELPSPPSRPTA